MVTITLNIPLGMWRYTVKKFSVSWFIAVHASVPFVIALRIWLQVPYWSVPVLIAVAILGQFIGSRIMAQRKAVVQEKLSE